VFTVISLLTTIFVLFVMVLVPSFKYRDWGAVGAYLLTRIVIGFGVVVNCIAGVCSAARGEYCGGWVAVIGMDCGW
jgi:hypothetical protein